VLFIIPIAMMIHIFLRLLLILFTISLLLGAVLIVIQFYFARFGKPGGPDLKLEDHRIILPLRLQAYERLILFLERILPNNLVLRINRPEMDAYQLQTNLIRTIREEFEYNLSQQLYVSSRSWELIKNAKEEMIKMINIAAGRVNESAPSAELARIIFELSLENDKPLPVSTAIEAIKKEIQGEF
jgi:hypothetical protein